jgi:galactonate dehydratase
MPARPNLSVTRFELLAVRANERAVWLMVRLGTDAGLTGLGECSDAFGFANTTKQDAERIESELRSYFDLIQGKSPLVIEAYREAAEVRAAAGGLIAATAYSAIEQALWDLTGKALELPVYAFFGGAVRDIVPVYANINRATKARTPAGFAEKARSAVAEGFRAVKAAPFDGFPKPGSPAGEIRAAVDLGIACAGAMRDAVGANVDVMIDAHSFFDVPLARTVAERLEPYKLAWYEEPVAPQRIEDMEEIQRSIRQPIAAGELLFGIAGFAPLCRRHAVNVIMPDVKHCGGLLEMGRIATIASADGIAVAPHNPTGPVSTAASVQMCANMKNFRILEYQWGEAPWRGELVTPPQVFERGSLRVPDRPGFGIELNDEVAGAHWL